jgi:AmmeMemoRadiSam system protein B
MDSIRKPAVAGAFYPDDPNELKSMIEKFLDEAKEIKIKGKLRALIVPHAGYIYSGPVAAYAYKLLQKHAGEFPKIILIGPSHFASFFGAAESGADGWQTPLGIVAVGSIQSKVKDLGMLNTIPQAHGPEHSLEVQLPFLQTVLKDEFTIYPILTGDIRGSAFSDEIIRALDDQTLIIVSSDLSHYLAYDKAVEKDKVTCKAINEHDLNLLEEKGDACGITGIRILMYIAKKQKWKIKQLDYRNSGDTAGPKDQVVGYGAFAVYSSQS